MKSIIMILIVGMVLVGCQSPPYGCIVEGYDKEVKDLELCKAIFENEREQYEIGKLVGKSCDDEVISDTYNSAYERCMEESSSNFMDNCLLIVTDGKQPKDNEWYQEMDIKQVGNYFPIRTWDLERDQIESYDGEEWKYYLVCEQ